MESNFFDHIYLVNLQQHRGKKLRSLAHLEDFGIKPTVFEASDGYIPPIFNRYETYSKNDLGSLLHFKRFNKLEIWRSKLFIDSPGAFGYVDTYIRILKDAKQKGHESILILEDDIILSKCFNERLKAFCSSVPDSWKFIGLGASQYDWDSIDLESAKSQGFYTPKQLDTCGSFAIGIRNTIFDELIELQSHFEAPFDHIPLGEIYRRYASNCYIFFPYIVMPDVRSSSIRGSRNQLTHAHKMKWNPELFDYPPKRLIINVIITSREQVKCLSTFSDKNTFPFELHLFVSSEDGLRPYHDSSQVIEHVIDTTPLLPNTGYCVKPNTKSPFTEDDILSLYESLLKRKIPTDYFKIIDVKVQKIDPDRVSVIIPTYKRSDILEDVLLSVILQGYENKEIIVVDDNPKRSVDQLKTEKIVSRLIEQYSDTKLVYISHNKNRKGAGARNSGILKSTGNYICFLDDDDLYLSGRLSLSIEKLKATPDYIGAVYCGFIGGNSAARTSERYTEGNLTKELLLLNYLAHFLNTNTATYKREAIIALNGFDETFIRHQDLELNLRFFEQYEMTVVPKQLISIRPKPTETNNQQYGVNLFETKKKFLDKFRYIINRFDLITQKNIYDNHWSEVVKYASDNMEQFEKHLLDELDNGYLQCYKILNDNKKAKGEALESIQISSIKTEIKNKTPKQCEENEDPSLRNMNSHAIFNKNITRKKTEVEIPSQKLQLKSEALKIPVLLKNKKIINNWQIKGANLFGLVFKKFILPPQRQKLINNPYGFFKDSKNTYTRFIGKILRII